MKKLSTTINQLLAKPDRELSIPVPQKHLNRFLILIIIVLAFLAGYYQSAYRLEIKKYLRLEDKYVRVRTMLGVEKTQELLNESYEKIETNY